MRQAGGGALAIIGRREARRGRRVAGATGRAGPGAHRYPFINNAAWRGPVAALADYDDEQFDRVMAINVRGVYLGLKHVLPMVGRAGAWRGGHHGSLGLLRRHAPPGPTPPAARRAGPDPRRRARGWRAKGVRVNAVCPGPVDTPMLQAIEAEQAPGRAEALRQQRAATIPDGRYASPQEVAHLMVYLVSDLSSHMPAGACRSMEAAMAEPQDAERRIPADASVGTGRFHPHGIS